jgi:crossover junction endodeoxyribonuclease RusA
VNAYWRSFVPRGGQRAFVHVSDQGKAYQKAVARVVAALPRYPIEASDRLAMHVIANPPDRRRRDLDNLGKALWDSLQKAGVYADDNQIDKFTIERGEVVDLGRLLVTVEVLPVVICGVAA